VTEKREIENYLHIGAIKAAYAVQGIEIAREENFGPFEDVPVAVARLVHEANGDGDWEALSADKRIPW
jgi:putative ATP-dependent endonuclease of the OLD family